MNITIQGVITQLA